MTFFVDWQNFCSLSVLFCFLIVRKTPRENAFLKFLTKSSLKFQFRHAMKIFKNRCLGYGNNCIVSIVSFLELTDICETEMKK